MRILSMSGFVPEQICDTIRFSQYHGDRNIAHYCGYASDFISQVKEDDAIDGAVFPKSCDSSRIISSYLKNTGKFIFQIPVPMNEDVDFFADIIKKYKEAVEYHYGISITNVVERASMVNARNLKIKEIYDNLGEISFSEYLSVIHELLKRPLNEQHVPDTFKQASKGKPVFIIGSFLSNLEIVKKLELSGLQVVGDTLTESGRIASLPLVRLEGDIYREISQSFLTGRLSPSQNNFEAIIKADLEEMEYKGIKGVVFITQKYCEPYDFLYSIYKTILDKNEIPSVKISLDDTENTGKAELALEAFESMI